MKRRFAGKKTAKLTSTPTLRDVGTGLPDAPSRAEVVAEVADSLP
jgi:hypothetical protein